MTDRCSCDESLMLRAVLGRVQRNITRAEVAFAMGLESNGYAELTQALRLANQALTENETKGNDK